MKLPFCVACLASEDLHHHHLVPKSKGGQDAETNLITLCHSCHKKLHGMTGEWGNHRDLTKAGMNKLKDSGGTWTRRLYGWDFKNGKATKNKREQQAIKLMLKLKDQGLKNQQIRDELHAKNFFAKNGGPWHRSALYKVIKRCQAEL